MVKSIYGSGPLQVRSHLQNPVDAIKSKIYIYIAYNRRKFRSQTSDSMDRWKSRGGKSQGGEGLEVRRSESKMQVREKVGKSRLTVFFQ